MGEFYSVCQIELECIFLQSDQYFKHAWELRRKKEVVVTLKKALKQIFRECFDLEKDKMRTSVKQKENHLLLVQNTIVQYCS